MTNIYENRDEAYDNIQTVGGDKLCLSVMIAGALFISLLTHLTLSDSTNIAEAKNEAPEIVYKLNSQWLAQEIIDLEAESIQERMNEILKRYDRYEDIEKNRWVRVGNKHWIRAEVLVCIAKADSSLGRELKTTNNFGNVWNNDRWDRVHFDTAIQWINAIGRVLNNKYLGHKQSIGSLSVWGGGNAPFYATSPENWNNNVLNCLSQIHNKQITEDFMIRI